MDYLRFILPAQGNVDFESVEFEGPGAAALIGSAVFMTVFVVATIAGFWKTFEKAGKPGWAAIVPIYQFVVMIQIAKMPMWWLILWIIPCTAIIPAIVVPINMAQKFGKGAGFGIGMAFLPFIFFPILGFGDARYHGVAD